MIEYLLMPVRPWAQVSHTTFNEKYASDMQYVLDLVLKTPFKLSKLTKF